MMPLLLFNAFEAVKMVGLYFFDSQTQVEDYLPKRMLVQQLHLTLPFLIFTVQKKKGLANLAMTCSAIELTSVLFAGGEKVGASMATTAFLMAMNFIIFMLLSLYGGGNDDSSREASNVVAAPVAVRSTKNPSTVRQFVTFYSFFLMLVLFLQQTQGFDPSKTFADLFLPTATITDTAKLLWSGEGVILIQAFLLYWSVWRHGTDAECEILCGVSTVTSMAFVAVAQAFPHVLPAERVRAGTFLPVVVAVMAVGAILRHELLFRKGAKSQKVV